MNVYLPNKRLPSAYQEVEYIESSGTQYIDTSVVLGASNFNINSDINCPNRVSGKEQAIFSIWTSTYNYWNLFIRNYDTIYDTIDCYTASHNEVSFSNMFGYKKNISLERTNNSWKLGVDSTSTTRSYTPGSVNNTTVKLFARGDLNFSNNNTKIKMYNCKITVGGTLVRDFVPCYRKSDNVIGLYDLVNNQFYTNAGTGTFSKGNDVTMAELKNAYIGEVWTPGSDTVAYYQFDGNLNDSSGNNRNLSMGAGSFTYGSLSSGAKYVQTSYPSYTNELSIPFNSGNGTFSFWLSFANGTRGGYSGSSKGATVFDLKSSTGVIRPVLSWDYNPFTEGFMILDVNKSNPYVPSVSNSWHLYTMVWNNGAVTIYIDGVSYASGSRFSANNFGFRLNAANATTDYTSVDKLSELIFENRQWTAQEISHYYNLTKSNYGL